MIWNPGNLRSLVVARINTVASQGVEVLEVDVQVQIASKFHSGRPARQGDVPVDVEKLR